MFPSYETWVLGFVVICLTMTDWVLFEVCKPLGLMTLWANSDHIHPFIDPEYRIILRLFRSVFRTASHQRTCAGRLCSVSGFNLQMFLTLSDIMVQIQRLLHSSAIWHFASLAYILHLHNDLRCIPNCHGHPVHVPLYAGLHVLIAGNRATNVYEEKALGIHDADEHSEKAGIQHVKSEGSYVNEHLSQQLAYDVWWVVLCTFISEFQRLLRSDKKNTDHQT
jgi:hypothetical protein